MLPSRDKNPFRILRPEMQNILNKKITLNQAAFFRSVE
jgi:hypothetical protein